ncbi:DUF4249 domain-containing protein [Bacteroidota bacterium]
MNLTIRIPFIFFLAIVIFSACERTLFIEVSEPTSKIVLNGIISPESDVWLNVSESVGASVSENKSYIPVEDATVRIYNEDSLLTTITENDIGNYISTGFGPQTGETYRIQVNVYGYPEASSTVRIPERVEITGFDTSRVLRNRYISNQGTDMEVKFYLKFSFQDPEEITNYYMLGAYYLENGNYHPIQLDTEDLEMNIYIKDGVEILAWNDYNFNGESREFNVSFSLYKYKGFETQIVFMLYSIEEEYFDYLKTYSQNFTVLNDDILMFEPVMVSTNIEGGYGIVAAVSSSYSWFNYTFK